MTVLRFIKLLAIFVVASLLFLSSTSAWAEDLFLQETFPGTGIVNPLGRGYILEGDTLYPTIPGTGGERLGCPEVKG